MAKKKKEKVPFHIKHNLKQYSYNDGGLKVTLIPDQCLTELIQPYITHYDPQTY